MTQRNRRFTDMFAGKLEHISSSMKVVFDELDADSDSILSAKEQAGIRFLLHQDLR
eukprot:SAG31_NODE_1544_length_7943_cov_4.076237_8_plen_56_part_00